MGFVYYVPGLGGPNESAVPGPLRAVLGAGAVAFRGVSAGPDKASGQLVGLTDAIGYQPNEQEWVDTGDGYWLGWTTGRLPGPQDLARARMVAGHDVRLADERLWHIPAAALAPRRMVLDGDEWVAGEPIAAFRPLGDAAARVFELFGQAGKGEDDRLTIEATDTELVGLALAGIGTNYHVGRHEANALGLISTEATWAVLEAVIDLPTLVAMEAAASKKAEAGGGSGSGSTASGDAD